MSINPPMVSCPSQLSLHEQASETRAEVEHFIHDRFATEHNAEVRDFLAHPGQLPRHPRRADGRRRFPTGQ